MHEMKELQTAHNFFSSASIPFSLCSCSLIFLVPEATNDFDDFFFLMLAPSNIMIIKNVYSSYTLVQIFYSSKFSLKNFTLFIRDDKKFIKNANSSSEAFFSSSSTILFKTAW